MAPPKIHPVKETAQAIKVMRASGLSVEKISSILELSNNTIYKHYKQEVDNGKSEIIAKISEGVIFRAINGDNASAFFYLKTQAGWRETTDVNNIHQNPDGSSIAPVSVDLTKVPTEILEALRNAGRPAGED